MATLRQIMETLSQTTGAQYLYQPVIDRALFEAYRNFTATSRIFARRSWEVPVYEFNTRNSYPETRAVVEAPPTTGYGSVTASSSNYYQTQFPVKHWQNNMDLSKFSIQTARVNGDLMQLELTGAAESWKLFEEVCNLYGSAGATQNTWRPEWDGCDLLMALASKILVGGLPSIALFDALIDSIKEYYGEMLTSNEWVFVMSPEMLSSIGRLFVQLERFMGKAVLYPRDDRGQIGGQVSDNRNYIDGGLEVATYRGIPLVESSFIRSRGQMTTVTPASPTGSDGIITAGTYYYAVEAVSDIGLSLAIETTQVTIGSTNHVVLSWTTPTITDRFGNSRQILLYRIHRTRVNGAAGTETLYAVIGAKNLATDAYVTSFTDTGAILTAASGGNTSTTVTVNSLSTEAISDGVTAPRLSPSSHTQQDIWLLPRDPDILCVPVINEMQTVPLALINSRTQQVNLQGDQVLAVRGPGFMAKASGVYVA